MKTITILLLALMTLAACETLVTDIPQSRLPETTSKLVVHSYISPQDPAINVVVSESMPIFSESDAEENVIQNALVKISDGTNEEVIPFDKILGVYHIDQSQFKIVASQSYTLSVSHEGRQVTARCKVPEKMPAIKSYKFDTLVTPNPAFLYDTAITLKMHWQDIPADTNYYRAVAAAEIEYSVPDPKLTEKRDKSVYGFMWDVNSGRSEWQSDHGLDGSLLSSPVGRVLLPNFNPSQPNGGTSKPVNPKSRLISVTMLVYSTDIHYFKYHLSMQQRLDTENPFTEPSPIYSNIEGGIGCFGAYNAGKLIYRPE